MNSRKQWYEMAKKVTIINFVLDESGSMNAVLSDTIGGFNSYIDTLKKEDKNIRFTLTKFSGDHHTPVYVDKALSEVPNLDNGSYKPNGWTPLYDAIAKTIEATEKAIAKGKPDVLTVILTDGQENASKEFNRNTLLTLIERKQADGWTFVYLGANQDACLEASSIGIPVGNVASYDVANTKATFGRAAAASLDYMASPDIKKRKRLLTND